MKKLILTISFLAAALASAQTAIDKTNTTSASASLEFGDNQYKGMVVPWVSSTTAANNNGAVDGTIIFDLTDNHLKAKENGTWKDYSLTAGAAPNASIQTGLVENVNLKAIIGATNSGAPGVVVLEESNKAMILPKGANPHLTIKNPAAGMLVYDTVSNSVAFFNGTSWTFWK